MDFQKLPTIGHSQKKCSKYSIVSEQNVQLLLSLTLILLRIIFVGYILCEMFHCNTLSLVSFVVFRAVCHTSSSKINPNSFCQKLRVIVTVLCLLVINSVYCSSYFLSPLPVCHFQNMFL